MEIIGNDRVMVSLVLRQGFLLSELEAEIFSTLYQTNFWEKLTTLSHSR